MSFLKGKKILIIGMTNKFSLSWGIAKQMYQYGAELSFTYHQEKNKKKIQKLAKTVNSNRIFFCDVQLDTSIINLFKNLSKVWSFFDGIVHSVVFSTNIKKKEFNIENISRKDFQITHDISSFSLLAIIKAAKKFLNLKSSILTLSFIGSLKYVPGYVLLNSAKSSLESNVKYLAYSLGKKNIRINVLSSGPILTSSSRKIHNFYQIMKYSSKFSPLRRKVTLEEIGNTASFLCSDLSSGITGQTIYVDSGFNIFGMFETI
ncbi:enoyl-ACP reductase FabI [Buchnera aphidicola]|uniref:Enoyl-[acyl-carrier-protein] reductase [NADH] n=1 Tax=Buchnera aphidicola subsp. Tuberolachnus salignus TaxID=98804 RepID=A0A170PBQ7_BUCTT|nr:enoyl-ACP reductase [Buchnera aphidicola]CUR53153.1 Enoyl-[acyl-carrier-protein] reductase [NADH] FabI [Buchnera aphidicola (Tuberolachnus salignus)]